METDSQLPIDPFDIFDQAMAAAQAGDEAEATIALGQVLALAELDSMPGSAYDVLVMAIESALPLLSRVAAQKLRQLRRVAFGIDFDADRVLGGLVACRLVRVAEPRNLARGHIGLRLHAHRLPDDDRAAARPATQHIELAFLHLQGRQCSR